MKAANNIQLVRIPIGASDRVYFPYSTSFYDKTIEQIMFAMSEQVTDITGAENYVATSTGSVFLTLYDRDNRIICKDLDISLLSDANLTDFIDLSVKVNWDTSYIKITDQTLLNQNKVLLVYIMYGGTKDVSEDFKNAIIITFPANLTRQQLSDYIIGNYGKLCRMEVANTAIPTDLFITLNDKSGRGYDTVSSLIFGRESLFSSDTLSFRIKNTLHVPDYDVDFSNSYIWTGSQPTTLVLFFK